MTISDVTAQRLLNQQIARTRFTKPEEIVSWLCGMQAQDYNALKWAIGLRMSGGTLDAVDQAIADKKIVRSWPLRNTLHTVAAQDLRWMLSLTGPRLIRAGKPRNRQIGLDEETMIRANDVLIRALEGGKQRTRKELAAILGNAGIDASDGIRLSHFLYRAGLEQLICFGVKRGAEFTYVLFDEWLPPGSAFDREEALAELARRYFISRGPATLPDFIWWSGLTGTEAKTGLEGAKQWLKPVTFAGQPYWLPKETEFTGKAIRSVFLLPYFDEYMIAYKDRSAIMAPEHPRHLVHSNGIFNPIIVVDGQVVGTWKTNTVKKERTVETRLLQEITSSQQKSIAVEADRYLKFLKGVP